MKRRKTGREKYKYLRRVYYLIINILKPVANTLRVSAEKKAGQFPGTFSRATPKRHRLWWNSETKKNFLSCLPSLTCANRVSSLPFPSLLPCVNFVSMPVNLSLAEDSGNCLCPLYLCLCCNCFRMQLWVFCGVLHSVPASAPPSSSKLKFPSNLDRYALIFHNICLFTSIFGSCLSWK